MRLMSLDVKSKQILLIGYHGQRNFGDDLFVSSILGLLPHC
jgi:polysaccharide pyruvyl transferase WcaK-like protein